MTPPKDKLLEAYEHRLSQWRAEELTNKHGMGHLAVRAIRLVEQEIAALRSRSQTTEPGEG
jgi:hypothetical protein